MPPRSIAPSRAPRRGGCNREPGCRSWRNAGEPLVIIGDVHAPDRRIPCPRAATAAVWSCMYSTVQPGPCLQIASSLTFTSCSRSCPLAPSARPHGGVFRFFSGLGEQIHAFLLANMAARKSRGGRNRYIEQFSSRAGQLTVLGTGVLAVAAFTMMFTIVGCVQLHLAGSRPLPWRTHLIYWATLTLGPILIGASFQSPRTSSCLPLDSPADTSCGYGDSPVRPFVLTCADSSCLPCRAESLVRWHHRPHRSLVAALAFEIHEAQLYALIAKFQRIRFGYGAFAVDSDIPPVDLSILGCDRDRALSRRSLRISPCCGRPQDAPRVRFLRSAGVAARSRARTARPGTDGMEQIAERASLTGRSDESHLTNGFARTGSRGPWVTLRIGLRHRAAPRGRGLPRVPSWTESDPGKERGQACARSEQFAASATKPSIFRSSACSRVRLA